MSAQEDQKDQETSWNYKKNSSLSMPCLAHLSAVVCHSISWCWNEPISTYVWLTIRSPWWETLVSKGNLDGLSCKQQILMIHFMIMIKLPEKRITPKCLPDSLDFSFIRLHILTRPKNFKIVLEISSLKTPTMLGTTCYLLVAPSTLNLRALISGGNTKPMPLTSSPNHPVFQERFPVDKEVCST